MYDTIIIGSGPAGMTAAIYATRARMHAVLVEKDYHGTGQVAEGGRIDNYPGLYGENGFDLGEKFRAHAKALGAEILEAEVSELRRTPEGYTVRFSDGTEQETKTILYAAGSAPRRLGIPGEAEFAGRGVSYCAICDGAFYADKTVAVIGGGDTALEDALHLSQIAAQVVLIHRRDTFRANKALQHRVRETPNITLIPDAQVQEIQGNHKVEALRFQQQDAPRDISVDGVFVAIGSIPRTALLTGLCTLDEGGFVVAGEDGVTSAPGIFAAGDVRTKPLRQIVTAVADGAVCVSAAESYLARQSYPNRA